MKVKLIFDVARQLMSDQIAGYKWRKLYRVMHRIYQPRTDSYFNIMRNMAALGRLAELKGRRVNNFADAVAEYMFWAIYENRNEKLVYSYNTLPLNERFEFIAKTWRTAHQNISADFPDVAPLIEYIQINNADDCYGSYHYPKRTIYMTPIGLERDINFVMGTVVHEYVHVLQHAHHTTLPPELLNPFHTHYWLKGAIKSRKRIHEKEAYFVGDKMSKNFYTKFGLYLANLYSHD